MLAHEPLGWFSHLRDVPISIAGETGGAGDDVRLNFGSLEGIAEAQAKSGLSGGSDLDDVLTRIRAKTRPPDAYPVALVVDRRTTTKIREMLAADADTFRHGREDALHSEAKRVIKAGYQQELRRLHVASADVTLPSHPEVKVGLGYLRRHLIDPSDAEKAWAVLVNDAGALCATRSERTRTDIVLLLEKHGIGVAVLPTAAQPARELDRVEALLDAFQPAFAVDELAHLEGTTIGRAAPRELRARLLFLRARALLQLAQVSEAEAAARESTALLPSAPGAFRVLALVAMQRGDQDAAMQYARRATDLASVGRSWGVRLRVATTFGIEDDPPPASMERDFDYRLVRAEIAAERQDWELVLDLTEDAGAEADRPTRLLMRATALWSQCPTRSGQAQSAEELASALLDRIGMASPYTSMALLVRAEARRVLGNMDAHEEDLSLARATSPDDPQVIRGMVVSLLRRGRSKDALDGAAAIRSRRSRLVACTACRARGVLRRQGCRGT